MKEWRPEFLKSMTGSGVKTANGLQIIFDGVGPYGPQVEFGKISHEEIGLVFGVIITSGGSE